MERKDLDDNFGFYPPSGAGIPPFLPENTSDNEASSPPQLRLGPLPPSLNCQVAGGNSSLESILNRRATPENPQMQGSVYNRYGGLRDDPADPAPGKLKVYWKSDVIEDFDHHSRRGGNQEQQQYSLPGSSSSSSNNFNLESAMSRLSLSNSALNRSSANNGGFGGGVNNAASLFDSTFHQFPISHRRLPSFNGTSNCFSPSSSSRRYPYSSFQNGERRFSAALHRQLQRERYATAAEFPPRNFNFNTLSHSSYANVSINGRFQRWLLPAAASLDELRGQLCFIAKDEYGSSFLAKKLLDRNPNEIEIIYWEIRDYLCELMVHQFAHHVVDKIIEVGSPALLTGVLHSVVSNDHCLIAVCNDMLGTHGVQNLLEHLTSKEQISMAVSALGRVVLILIKHNHGQHVIKCCVNRFTSEDNKDLLNEVANNCLEIARDKTGCCVLQECVVQAEGEPKDYLLGSIISNSLVLSKDPYGNFVVQNALEQNIAYVTEEIIKRLSGSFSTLCFDKFGSHVVERCLSKTNDQIIRHIITEIMCSQDFLSVVQSPFGNYVIQTALMTSKGMVYNSLVNRIQDDYAFLLNHPFGRRVLLRVRETRSRLFIS